MYVRVFICRSSYVITFFFMLITAAVLAETCSALPAAGSIYLYAPAPHHGIELTILQISWAAESGGAKYGRLFGFIVAWWSSTAWTTFCAAESQGAANYLLAEINA